MPQKHSEASPTEKLLSLYALLLFNGGNPFSLKELSTRLDCSKQTVLRLVDQIGTAEYGEIVQSRRGREVYYAIERPRRLPGVSLNAEGLYQLALCRKLLLGLLPRGMKEQADKTLGMAGPDAVALGRADARGHIDYTPFQPMLETFMQAMHARKVCAVAYRTRLGRAPRVFAFAPKNLVACHETLSVLGWEVTEKGKVEALCDDSLSLYLHRCVSVDLTPRTGEDLPPPKIVRDEEGGGLFGSVDGEVFSVRVRFAPGAATYVYERQWSGRQSAKVHEDGSLTLDFDARSRAEVVSWLLGFGDQATALSPGWLREEMRRQASIAVEKY
ncbi:MAG: WYL domain-containing protein [Desulfovibrio sp.]|jgi:predicted DNA-binding transcriptional regulator YafY|nr:WYL domain-containing protein [Desulfovibrio sp.]